MRSMTLDLITERLELADQLRGKTMDAKMFDGFDHAQYEEEARQRRGDSPGLAKFMREAMQVFADALREE